jgi:hypothetical protein
MNIFVIDSDNNITVFGSGEELPETAGTGKFKSREELGQLAETWPVDRLVEIWNTVPGRIPVKKFTDRKTAVGRIWKAVQSLRPAVAPEVAHVAAPAIRADPPGARPRAAYNSADHYLAVCRRLKLGSIVLNSGDSRPSSSNAS